MSKRQALNVLRFTKILEFKDANNSCILIYWKTANINVWIHMFYCECIIIKWIINNNLEFYLLKL